MACRLSAILNFGMLACLILPHPQHANAQRAKPWLVTTSGVALALSPNSVSVTLTTGTKASQTIRLVNPNGNSGLSNIGANIQSNQNWCGISGFDGSSFKVTIDATSLPPGTANASVTVQYNGNGSPFVTVSLAVRARVATPATPVASPSTPTSSLDQNSRRSKI